MTEEIQDNSEEENDELKEQHYQDFYNYINSKNGHEIVNKTIDKFFEFCNSIKKSTLDSKMELNKMNIEYSQNYSRNTLILQGFIFISVILAACALAFFNKFDSTIGLLFGTLVGFLFGKKSQ